MDLIEKTVQFVRAIETADWFTVESLLADEFRFYGPTPDPVDKQAFLGVLEAVKAALPDLNFQLTKVEEIGKQNLELTIHIRGTHTKPLKLPENGARALPPTLAHVHLPREEVKVEFRGGKISKIHTANKPHTGILGILEQLGLEA